MRQIAIRYFLLNKRLFKKYSFLFIICLVPLFVGGMRLAAQGESGIFRIALYLQNPTDRISAEIVKGFLEEEGILQYEMCQTEEEAAALVKNFQADAAWLFPENLEEAIRQAAAEKRTKPVVTMVEREETISLVFAREILCNALYPYFSYAVYQDFIRDDMGLTEVSDKALQDAYEETLVTETLFQMAYLDEQQVEESNYLLTPLRGILAIWLVLCGFAGAMYFIQDEQAGTYSCMPIKNRFWVAFGVQSVLLSDAVLILLLACRLSGMFTLWYREIISAVLFSCCTMVFCNLIRLLCSTPERLGSCIPILLMGMMILCPVFINVRGWRAAQYLLPPYYYLKSIHSNYYLYGMVIYTLILILLNGIIFRWKNRK